MRYFGSLFRAAFVCAGILAAVAAGTGPVCAENSAWIANMNSGSGLAESAKEDSGKDDSNRFGPSCNRFHKLLLHESYLHLSRNRSGDTA